MVEGKGLHEIRPPAGTYIQFACEADRTASDGLETDRNGLFTKHLLKHITNPNEDMIQIFQGIAADVYDESGEKQKPLSINGLMRRGHIYLNESVAVSSGKIYKRDITGCNLVFGHLYEIDKEFYFVAKSKKIISFCEFFYSLT